MSPSWPPRLGVPKGPTRKRLIESPWRGIGDRTRIADSSPAMAMMGRRPIPRLLVVGMSDRGAVSGASAPPLSRETLFRRFGPVVGLTLLALLYAAPPRTGGSAAGPVVEAAFLAAVAATATVVVPWDRLPSFARLIPAFVYLAVVFLAREAPGDTGAPYAQVVLIPVMWLALYGDPKEMTGGLLAAG